MIVNPRHAMVRQARCFDLIQIDHGTQARCDIRGLYQTDAARLDQTGNRRWRINGQVWIDQGPIITHQITAHRHELQRERGFSGA